MAPQKRQEASAAPSCRRCFPSFSTHFGQQENIPLRPISFMGNAITPSLSGPLYGVNAPRGLFEGSTYYGTGDAPTILAAVNAPADIVMLIDGRKDYYDWCGCGKWLNSEIDWCYAAGDDLMWPWELPLLIFSSANDPTYRAWRKHTGGANVAFADGHSKSLRPGDLDQGKRWLVNPLP